MESVYKTIVYYFFSLKRFAFRAYNAYVMQLWPGAKHSTYDAMSVRNP